MHFTFGYKNNKNPKKNQFNLLQMLILVNTYIERKKNKQENIKGKVPSIHKVNRIYLFCSNIFFSWLIQVWLSPVHYHKGLFFIYEEKFNFFPKKKKKKIEKNFFFFFFFKKKTLKTWKKKTLFLNKHQTPPIKNNN